MKKQNLYSIIICILFFQGCFSQQDKSKVQNSSIVSDYSQDYTQEHIVFLEEFYREYIGNTKLSDDEVILKKYCTPSLIANIRSKQCKFEIGNDPFIYAQDIWVGVLEFLEVEKVTDSINKYIVSYRYSNEDDKDRTKMMLEIINTDDGFKINGVGGLYTPEIPQEGLFIRGN